MIKYGDYLRVATVLCSTDILCNIYIYKSSESVVLFELRVNFSANVFLWEVPLGNPNPENVALKLCHSTHYSVVKSSFASC